MKKIILVLFLIILNSCKNDQNNMKVNVDIKNFKKGMVYFQKISDSALINIDSIFINSGNPISFSYNIESPELFYINLDISKIENRIEFFGDKGQINISTSLEKFNSDYKVSGSLSDSIYRDYLKMIKKFNDKTLDLIELSFNLSKTNLIDSIKKVEKEIESLNKRRYLYNLNYVVNNGNNYISPLIAINEFSESSELVKDTIIKSMSKKVLDSKYGKIYSEISKNIL